MSDQPVVVESPQKRKPVDDAEADHEDGEQTVKKPYQEGDADEQLVQVKDIATGAAAQAVSSEEKVDEVKEQDEDEDNVADEESEEDEKPQVKTKGAPRKKAPAKKSSKKNESDSESFSGASDEEMEAIDPSLILPRRTRSRAPVKYHFSSSDDDEDSEDQSE